MVLKYKSGYKYQVYETFSYDSGITFPNYIKTDFFEIMESGRITAFKGYAFDGGSSIAVDTEMTMIATLLHDILYQAMRLKLLSEDYRDKADRLLQSAIVASSKVIAKEDYHYWFTINSYLKWAEIRAGYYYTGVHNFAEPFANPKHEKPPLEAR